MKNLDLFRDDEAAPASIHCKEHSLALPPLKLGQYIQTDDLPFFQTSHGALFDGDCTEFLRKVRSDSIDTVFADPPFNLKKQYGAKSNDNLPDAEYVSWCKEWLDECIRVLKPGGSLYVYNLPRWNIILGAYLMERWCFRNPVR